MFCRTRGHGGFWSLCSVWNVGDFRYPLYLRDHPRTCKWFITMVTGSCCPLTIGLFPFQMAFLWLVNGGDPNYLLSGVILQVAGPKWSTLPKTDSSALKISLTKRKGSSSNHAFSVASCWRWGGLSVGDWTTPYWKNLWLKKRKKIHRFPPVLRLETSRPPGLMLKLRQRLPPPQETHRLLRRKKMDSLLDKLRGKKTSWLVGWWLLSHPIWNLFCVKLANIFSPIFRGWTFQKIVEKPPPDVDVDRMWCGFGQPTESRGWPPQKQRLNKV